MTKEELAEILDETPQKVAEKPSENAYMLFDLD